MTPELAQKFGELVEAGATVVACVHGRGSPSFTNYPAADAELAAIMGEPPAEDTLIAEQPGSVREMGAGRLIFGPIKKESFSTFGIEPDFLCFSTDGGRLSNFAWNHRHSDEADWYFLSNQTDSDRDVIASFRVTGKRPEIWNPATGKIAPAETWTVIHGRTVIPLRLAPSGSVFVVFREPTNATGEKKGANWPLLVGIATLDGVWSVAFESSQGGPSQPVELANLMDWSKHQVEDIKHFSGTATYRNSFAWKGTEDRVWLDLGEVHNVAGVGVNGVECGTAWTPPYRVEITKALHPGVNDLEIAVTNTWANRLIGDAKLPAEKRISWMTAPLPPADTKLLPAGLLGPVRLLGEGKED